MSGSCVVPRERMLDLLDDLHESVPVEIVEARQVLSQREALLAEATETHRQAAERAGAEATSTVSAAEQHAAGLVGDAEVRVHELVEAGKAEHAELVSASRVHRTATVEAAQARDSADEYAAAVRAQADQYAAALRTDAESFADRTLADLVSVLHQATDTAQQGREALAARREGDHERDERSREEPAARDR